MPPTRKNNDTKFAWYIEQSDVDYANKMLEEGRLMVYSGGCRIPEGVTHLAMLDSDGFIMGIKQTGHNRSR